MAEMSGLHFLLAGNIYLALPLTSDIRISLYSQNSPRPNCSFALSRNTYFLIYFRNRRQKFSKKAPQSRDRDPGRISNMRIPPKLGVF